MCFHLWNFHQKHTWRQLLLVNPSNSRLSIIRHPSCALIQPQIQPHHFTIEIDVFSVYRLEFEATSSISTKWGLEIGVFVFKSYSFSTRSNYSWSTLIKSRLGIIHYPLHVKFDLFLYLSPGIQSDLNGLKNEIFEDSCTKDALKRQSHSFFEYVCQKYPRHLFVQNKKTISQLFSFPPFTSTRLPEEIPFKLWMNNRESRHRRRRHRDHHQRAAPSRGEKDPHSRERSLLTFRERAQKQPPSLFKEDHHKCLTSSTANLDDFSPNNKAEMDPSEKALRSSKSKRLQKFKKRRELDALRIIDDGSGYEIECGPKSTSSDEIDEILSPSPSSTSSQVFIGAGTAKPDYNAHRRAQIVAAFCETCRGLGVAFITASAFLVLFFVLALHVQLRTQVDSYRMQLIKGS